MRLSPGFLLLLAGCEGAAVKLDDTATDTLVSGSIAVTPRSIEFGVVFVGQSPEAEITVRNAGSGEVAVTLEVVGAWATDYTLDAYTSAPAAGEVSSHVLKATPTEWGDHGVSVVVDDAVSGGHIEIPVTMTVQLDADGDGYGSLESGGDDCLDTDATVHPDAEDPWYDGIDSDCAGNDDYDQDADGVTVEHDCDDEDPSVYPGAHDEWYDGVDSDCAGNDDYDQDGDGVPLDHDCDDENPDIHPGAPDPWYDGVDTDCAGNDDYDQDGDGYPLDADCDDEDATIHPGAEDAWYDGIDSDCAGNDDYDQDGDGVTVETDCNDTDPTTTGPADETLDGVDNDCDGVVDDVPVADVSAGVVYGSARSMSLGDKGTIALDADVTGDGAVDLVVAAGEVDYGYAWLVDGADFVGAAGAIGDYDTAMASGSWSYELRYVGTPAADLDGDGAAELVLNASTEGSYDYGVTYVFDGASASGTLDTGEGWVYTFSGDSYDDLLLQTAMGDFDGDGVADVATGSPKDNNSSSYDVGNVAFFDGTALSGAMAIDDGTQVHGTSSYDYLGYRLAAGDVTGDGYVDLLAGAPGDDDAGSAAGAVYVFAGAAAWTWGSTADTDAYAKLTGAAAGDSLGEDPIPVPGDIDGDGTLDIGLASEEEGKVWLFLASGLAAGSTSAGAAPYTITGTAGDLGSALVIDSDLDGDGADEVVVGADGADYDGSNSGVVWVFRWDAGWGSALGSADAVASIYGTGSNAYLGSGLTGGGDVDGDGREDVAIGSVSLDTGATDGGAVYLLLGW